VDTTRCCARICRGCLPAPAALHTQPHRTGQPRGSAGQGLDTRPCLAGPENLVGPLGSFIGALPDLHVIPIWQLKRPAGQDQESYRGEHVGDLVLRIAKLFPDIHRELHRVNVLGDMVAIEVSIQGTFLGPLETLTASSSRRE
jgi:hypothetical protein